MATILTNPQEIPAPVAPARRYGILDAAVQPGQLSNRAIASGITFLAEDCGTNVTLYNPDCTPPQPTKPFAPGTASVESAPYWVISTYQCGTVGTSAADVSRRARRRYEAGVQNAIESTIWTGNGMPGVPNLSTDPSTIVVPGAPGAGTAIAALEEAFYDEHGYVGTIHMNTRGYAAVRDAGLMDRQGSTGVWRTPKGTGWSIGDGYGITGPGGDAPDAGFVWAFITPQVYLWNTPVNQPDPTQTLDRATNQWMAVAESVWLHAWLCETVFAVQVPIAAPAASVPPAVPA